MCVRRKEDGFATGGRENDGREEGAEKSARSSSVESGSGGSMGRYLSRTEAIINHLQLGLVLKFAKTRNPVDHQMARTASCHNF
jgi:hypothetical protein